MAYAVSSACRRRHRFEKASERARRHRLAIIDAHRHAHWHAHRHAHFAGDGDRARVRLLARACTCTRAQRMRRVFRVAPLSATVACVDSLVLWIMVCGCGYVAGTWDAAHGRPPRQGARRPPPLRCPRLPFSPTSRAPCANWPLVARSSPLLHARCAAPSLHAYLMHNCKLEWTNGYCCAYASLSLLHASWRHAISLLRAL
eukprot:5952533-Pleurochrysis_carterae.AAC.2